MLINRHDDGSSRDSSRHSRAGGVGGGGHSHLGASTTRWWLSSCASYKPTNMPSFLFSRKLEYVVGMKCSECIPAIQYTRVSGVTLYEHTAIFVPVRYKRTSTTL